MIPVTLPRVSRSPQSAAPRAMALGHVPALDAIRGLAILAVTLYRFHTGPDDPTFAGQVLDRIARGGVRGVDLFFVLSGFLITSILVASREEPHALRRFFIRRSLRIFPLYYATLLALLVVVPVMSSAAAAYFASAEKHQLWFWFYGANIYQAWRGTWAFGPLDHFWSLAVEEHFYLLWPFLIICFSRAAAIRICALCIIGALLGRMAWIAGGGNVVAPEVLTLFRLDALAAGGLLALILHSPRAWHFVVRAAPWCLALMVPAVGAAVVLKKRFLTLPDTCTALLCVSLIVVMLDAAPHTLRGRLGRSRVLRFFGKYSYAMYVFQNPLIPLLAPLLSIELLADATGSLLAGRLVYIVLMTLITTAAAWLSWHLFEKHMLALRDRFAPPRATPARERAVAQGNCSSCTSPAISAAADQRFS